MLSMKKINKAYGNLRALHDFDMEVKKGALYGLVGPNGAGKTTCIKIMTGLISPDSGSMNIEGSIGYIPDSFGIYDNLTVWEYMDFFASAQGMGGLTARKKCLNLLGQVGLDDKVNLYVDSLSRGMQQRLCLARALINDPEFLVMDEPTSGLDPGTRFEFKEIMMELHGQGKTILVSSHILSELSQMCTDLGIIENGSLILSGSMEDILERIENSNPIKVIVMDGVRDAVAIMKRNPNVKTISLSGKTFLLNFDGTGEDEAELLAQLVGSDIPVREFVREPGSLEKYFMQITGHTEEKVILQNDY